MSNYWHLECPTHNERTEEVFNQGDDTLRHLWSVRHLIANMLGDSTGWLVIEILGHGSEFVTFVIGHEWCPVYLYDEYGYREQLRAPGEREDV